MTVAGFAALHDARSEFISALPMTASTANANVGTRSAAGVIDGQAELALIALPHVDECTA